jgi:hypothetical protein
MFRNMPIQQTVMRTSVVARSQQPSEGTHNAPTGVNQQYHFTKDIRESSDDMLATFSFNVE